MKSNGETGWDDALKEQASEDAVAKKDVHSVTFDEIEKTVSPQGGLNLDFILEIPLKISAELGRCKMPISDLLQLGQGSVVELDKMAGEPMDIYVNSRLIARGEVVVVNEKFGVRLTDVVSPTERINNLKSP